MKKIRVAFTKRLTQNAFLLGLEVRKEFVPGQVIEITEDPALPPRLYSICSAPGNETMDVLFDIKPGGRLTPLLSRLSPGDTVYIGDPMGNFSCPDNEKAFWIAAGTGIAPFFSMFASGNRNNKILIHGGRSDDSFYFSEYFLPILNDRYIRCCSGMEGQGLYHGRLTSWLKEQESMPVDYKYYLCGSAEMVVQTRDILVSKGIGFESIMAEIYF